MDEFMHKKDEYIIEGKKYVVYKEYNSNIDELIEHICEYLISLFEEEIIGDLKNDL